MPPSVPITAVAAAPRRRVDTEEVFVTSSVNGVQAAHTPTPLQKARLVDESPAEEKLETRKEKAAEAAAEQAKKAAAAPTAARNIDALA